MPKRYRDSDWSDEDAPDNKRSRNYDRREDSYDRRSPGRNDRPGRYSNSPNDRYSQSRERSYRDSPPYEKRRDYGGHRDYNDRHRGYRPRSRYDDRRYGYNNRPPMPRFDEEDRIIREENPHLQQNKEKVKILDSLERILPKDAPQREYYQRKGELRSTNHWGQRKLLLSEIEFLTEHGHKSSTVVYAGAAPGPRNEYLADLFPKHKFIFIDPNPFHEKLRRAAEGNDRMELISETFTDELALTYRGKNVLFISNIRTADNTFMSKEEVDKTLVEDNRRQMSWHLQMEPVVSMLKFRLPWGAGITKYLSGYSETGKLYLPVWGGQTTTETSLVVSGNETYDYDNTVYEQQMFYFNTVQRCNYYKHAVKVQGVIGLCHCYDCSAEVQILANWAKKFPKEWADSDSPTEIEIAEHVEMMCERLNKECSAVRRNLATKVTASWHKRYAKDAIGWDTGEDSPSNSGQSKSPDYSVQPSPERDSETDSTRQDTSPPRDSPKPKE